MRTPAEHIKTLQRRVDFLKAREYRNSYDAAELGSLEWALVNLPPQRKPLTNEEIMNIAQVSCIGISPHEDTLNFAKVIEAVHGIKE